MRLTRSLRGGLHLALGRIWQRLGRKDLARKEFEEVLQFRGDDFRAYLELGRLALAEGDTRTAIREFVAARRTDPERFSRVHDDLGTSPVLCGPPAATETTAGSSQNGPSLPGYFDRDGHQGNGPGTQPSAWFWYVQAGDQSGSDIENLGWTLWGHEQRTPGGEDAFPWASSDEDFWANLDAAAADRDQTDNPSSGDDPWWRDSLDEFGSSDEALIGREEEPSWAESPLAEFYSELDKQIKDLRDAGPAARGHDFTSEDEQLKFRDLPPIRRSDVDDVNWDDIASRLSEYDG